MNESYPRIECDVDKICFTITATEREYLNELIDFCRGDHTKDKRLTTILRKLIHLGVLHKNMLPGITLGTNVKGNEYLENRYSVSLAVENRNKQW